MTIALVGFTIWFALTFGNSSLDLDEAAQIAAIELDAAPPGTGMQNDDNDNEGFFVLDEPANPRISHRTRMIYDYYLTDTGGFNTIIEYPALFLLDMTKEELVTMFADWQVLAFSSEEVHLRQNQVVEYRLYVIGVHDGYIAVFYDDEDYNIKELTSRPITALAAEEQTRLESGIRVTGAEELLRALEDFGS